MAASSESKALGMRLGATRQGRAWRALAALAAVVMCLWVIGAGSARSAVAEAAVASQPREVASEGFALASGQWALVVRAQYPFGDVQSATLVDQTTGVSRPIAVPIGCTPRALGPTAIVYACPASPSGDDQVYNYRSGRLIELPVAGDPVRVGRQWVEIDEVSGSPHVGTSVVFAKLDGTDVQPDFEKPGGTSYAALNTTNLQKRVCRPLHVPAVQDPETTHFRPGRLAFAGPVGISTNLAGTSFTRVQRCGERRVYSYKTGLATFNRRVLIWSDGVGALQGVYLRSHQRFEINLSGLPARQAVRGLAITKRFVYVDLETSFSVWRVAHPDAARS